jgi:AmmeMemoRadiSam system protein B
MSKSLPRLRAGLDIFPSPVPERPGLLLRDPFRYTEDVIIIPPLLASGLLYFDGARTEIELQAHLSSLTGQLVFSDIIETMVEALRSRGFLETEEFEQLRARRQADFAAAPLRLPVHAGTAYPDQAESLRLKLDQYLRQADGHASNTAIESPDVSAHDSLIGIAAPHVSPEGGWASYAAAYSRLPRRLANRTIVLLGTSHYGVPEKFGLTRKPFITPLGTLEVNTELVDWITTRAGDAITMEDYCHSVEHSLEFQCIFLQQMLGSEFKIVPILCGPFADGLLFGHSPETDPKVKRFFESLGELAELHRSRLFWVLGIDLAHMGRRYGDTLIARAEHGQMLEVRELDAERLRCVCEGDGAGFFELVKPDHDRLKWCGFSPLYTFLQTVKSVRGNLLRYEQWNIDDQSVVSFAALEFTSL